MIYPNHEQECAYKILPAPDCLMCVALRRAYKRGYDERTKQWQDVLASANKRAAGEALDRAKAAVDGLLAEETVFGFSVVTTTAVIAAIESVR